jgi:hypothetical protein
MEYGGCFAFGGLVLVWAARWFGGNLLGLMPCFNIGVSLGGLGANSKRMFCRSLPCTLPAVNGRKRVQLGFSFVLVQGIEAPSSISPRSCRFAV